ncbi:RluA family pseudouridine synthase [Lutibacter sp. A80]|uniref:RluA family pseudouridine synthase n=1 Tax=Lutibacter sp. A80 TaxID=2918453 RepID=UPI001F06959B|nr:RluA family pseudouridine synthase [Lutibacter sp. A80]UMB60448.1 RluA family pseudouridine synthase [Lutibacter sp. A80]
MQEYAPKIFYTYIPSNSGVKKAIKQGRVLIDGVIAKTATWVKPDQIIELIDDPNKQPKVYKFNLEVIFEDDHIAVINKPAGITVSGNKFKTIANALSYNLKKSQQLDALTIPTPVHRLDNQTSGILLVAKTKTAQIELGKQFKNQTIKKQYSAIVIGKIIKTETIDLPIDNKPSITNFEVVKSFHSLKYDILSLIKAFPKTGRTHQIRIHMASINRPILGDKLYGNPETIHKGKGLFLCASKIIFEHPKTSLQTTIKINLPQKFTSIITREERRWNNYNS